MDTATPPPQQTEAGKAKASRFSVIGFFLPVALLLAAVFATTAAIAVLVPDDGDYAEASNLKHDLLAIDVPKKIVLVGGSNVSYGTDSTIIETATHCPVINMGMNGYFGVRFMLEEVKPYLKQGDIVVIAWEYDSFYKSVNGTNTDLLMVSKANPRAFKFLTPRQKVSALSRIPFIAQQKVLRLMGEGYDNFSYMLGADQDEPWTEVDILEIESARNFSRNGDLTGHVGITWPHEQIDAMDISSIPMDQEVIPMMQQFVRDMNARGVRVMISWTPLMDDFYDRHSKEIDRLNAEMAAVPEFLIPRPASGFRFDKKLHFDTVYHLNENGRPIRSQMLADDILTQFGDDALCDSQP
ncbi:MAG: hypothetical protein CVT79_13415 [Alphaproteobacteria bacterium HGW-Alphaproteobacteria-18]|nr:MAG: hypothetical protein CVT79_13415 [Alphaproteobacteria bacterium HGW-Alphaproteobacteria-18]